jgi:hypothetical protein
MPQDKPKILIIWGDDIGWFNIGDGRVIGLQALRSARKADLL